MISVLLFFLNQVLMLIFKFLMPIIFTMVLRIYILKYFYPNINYDLYFSNLSLKNKNSSYLVINLETNSKNYSEMFSYLKNKLSKYLIIKNNQINDKNYNNLNKRINNVNDILVVNNSKDFDINKELTKYQKNYIKIIADKPKFKFYILIDHAYESGLSILNNFFFNQNDYKNIIRLPKQPKYYPILTEILIIRFIFRSIYYLYFVENNFNCPKCKNTNPKYSFSNKIYYSKLKELKSYITKVYLNNHKISFIVLSLAKAIITSFKCLCVKKKFFNVCLLTGYEGNKTINNCFSFIILNIDTNKIPNLSNNKYINQDLLINFIIYLNDLIIQRKSDSLVSFIIINYYLSNSFFLNKLNSNFNSNNAKPIIDLIFSGLPQIYLKDINNKSFKDDYICKTLVCPRECTAPLYCLCYTINKLCQLNFTIYDDHYYNNKIEYYNQIYGKYQY